MVEAEEGIAVSVAVSLQDVGVVGEISKTVVGIDELRVVTVFFQCLMDGTQRFYDIVENVEITVIGNDAVFRHSSLLTLK